ncbi:MAG: hypothetical protein JNJ82_21505 [Opitutaceae bacterium]|nr:hypothetical protein [Opitutaceae bacterium]
MNREEAQFILGAYRPNGADAHDPQFQDALALAQRDPELGRWLAEQQALDRAFSAKIRSRPLPGDLKAQLLLARTTVRRGAWWRKPVWLATAACFAVLLVAGGLLLSGRGHTAEFAAFRDAMAAASADMGDHADVWGLDTDGYRKWLAKNRGTSDFVLPASLADRGIAACKIVEWQGHRVTMLCLKSGGQHLDLFVINASELPGIALGSKPLLVADSGATTAAWQHNGNVYLLAGTIPMEELRQLL